MTDTNVEVLIADNKGLIEQNKRLLQENADQKQEIVQLNLRLEFEKRVSGDLNEKIKLYQLHLKEQKNETGNNNSFVGNGLVGRL
jgi:hypothetical protein